ncbi:DASH complex component Dam1 [Aspergillus arachidicola]|uniref:DASH complex subunit DAM1 n=1 Tax=Aspergillus arachidicola TaxID=656916 RepID=A0A2G7FYU2_9EURO|nr:DASH complex component Dam1 [Aspergillus arachidicola]
MDPTAFSRSSSRPRPSSRPTTPLRPSSRSSLREAHGYGGSISNAGYTQPAINALEPQFAELADSMADLEANFMHLQLMHESLTRFSESFASFLYGLNMNAFCVDFPEAPIPESFKRAKQAEAQKGINVTLHLTELYDTNTPQEAEVEQTRAANEGETTFMTTDTTFVENPSSTISPKPRHQSSSSERATKRQRVKVNIIDDNFMIPLNGPTRVCTKRACRFLHSYKGYLSLAGISLASHDEVQQTHAAPWAMSVVDSC